MNNEEKMIKRLDNHDEKFDKISATLHDHNKKFDKIFAKLLDHDHQLENIISTMVTKSDLQDLTNLIIERFDEMYSKHDKLDQERLAMHYRQREQGDMLEEHDNDIKTMKKVLKPAN